MCAFNDVPPVLLFPSVAHTAAHIRSRSFFVFVFVIADLSVRLRVRLYVLSRIAQIGGESVLDFALDSSFPAISQSAPAEVIGVGSDLACILVCTASQR